MSEPLYHPITIQNLTLDGNIFLAPLAGYTDVPFRTLAKEGGADLTFTEMVSVEGLSREGEKTLALLERSPLEEQYAVQLFLYSTESLGQALDLLLPFSPSMIDINCGCPVPKVTKTGAGSAMMKNPALITEAVRIIKERTGLPVSVKLRIGWDQGSRNYLAFSQAALDGGADMLTLHARTRSQGYAPWAEWETLATLKRYVTDGGYTAPVFGSGDLFEPVDAQRMLAETGIDGVMFARGAIGNPMVFNQAKAILRGEEVVPLSRRELQTLIIRHLDLMIAHYGEEAACKAMRKHSAAYLKGIGHSSSIKQALVQAVRREHYLTALNALVDL
ncbi:MAG: tRNA dihydrouridine synthase DusB [Sphaerochaeta sp.]|jgi:tRNA-dihydrouridine synthase B|nr:tRNA dihydrouridine synthase DusB [Sphaerochaeta sp.]